jgi:hypothetical protein
MGINDWRAKKHMKYPERGVLRVTGFYDAHPGSSPSGTRITGVIVAPGIQATAVEHKADDRGRWAGVRELPVLVDRADPARFVILWDEVQPVSWRDQEMQAAQAEAERINAGPPSSYQFGPGTTVTSTVVTIGPDGQPSTAPMSPQTAAHVQEALVQVFSQADAQAFGQVISQVFGQPSTPPYGQTGGDAAAFPQVSWSDQDPPGTPETGRPSSR